MLWNQTYASRPSLITVLLHNSVFTRTNGIRTMSLGRRLFSPTPVIVLIAAFATYQTVMRSTTVLPIIAGTLLPLTTTLSPSDPLHTYTIAADGINATFIGYGATLTSLFVNDKNEVPRELNLVRWQAGPRR